jgi:hypothetical protein
MSSLISRLGARARANESKWAKVEQEEDVQRRRRRLLDESSSNDDDDDDGNGANKRRAAATLSLPSSNKNDHKRGEDGVSKLSEVYAQELRLSTKTIIITEELRKHKQFFEDDKDDEEVFNKRTAFPENQSSSSSRRRDRWGFREIREDLERRKLERNTQAGRLALEKLSAVHRQTNAAALRALFYASCLAVAGVAAGSAAAAFALDIGGVDDIRAATRRNFLPTVTKIRDLVDEYNLKRNVVVNDNDEQQQRKLLMLNKIEKSEFVVALRGVFRMKKPPSSTTT